MEKLQSAVGELTNLCEQLCSDYGIEFGDIWWIDRPDRASVTAGVPEEDMANAISRHLALPRFDRREVVVLDGDIPASLRAGSLLVDDGGRIVELCDGIPQTDYRAEVCSYGELRALVEGQWRDDFTEAAVDGLFQLAPEHSAKYIMSKAQFVVLCIAAIAFLVAVWTSVITFLQVALGLVNLFLFASVAFKLVAVLSGLKAKRPEYALDEIEDYPFYTILAPVFREPEVVRSLAKNLGEMNYPADRFEILLLLEEIDDVTAEALVDIPGNLLSVVVPASSPQTKPKACNWALHVTRGEFCVIYDAEDKPDVDQLLIALAAFQTPGNEDVLVVQGALDYWNDEQNPITRMFALEYAWWFQCMLPGLSALGVPIPLGGTSNHFRSGPLREIHGWDGYNVTEDADLGIRASAHGWRVSIIPSMTKEEANSQAWNFVRQRSRWLKGYMMTALVRTRHPIELYRTVGIRGFASFVFLIAGTPFTFLVTPVLWVLFFLSITIGPEWLAVLFEGRWGTLATINLFVVNAVVMWLNLMACTYEQRSKLVWWTFANPFYWLLHSTAAYMGLYELIVKPHFWQKTNHGLAGPRSDDEA